MATMSVLSFCCLLCRRQAESSRHQQDQQTYPAGSVKRDSAVEVSETLLKLRASWTTTFMSFRMSTVPLRPGHTRVFCGQIN